MIKWGAQVGGTVAAQVGGAVAAQLGGTVAAQVNLSEGECAIAAVLQRLFEHVRTC